MDQNMDTATAVQVELKVVLILCGLIASGKSTFAESLQEYFPNFRRCNQDDLGDRRRVEQLARQSLRQGLSVCIDRTNFNSSQRAFWVDIAHEFPGTSIWVIVFDTPYEECAARLQGRTSHPTIKTPEEGLSVLSRFAADFRYPASNEGYDRVMYLKPADHASPVYTRAEVAAILQKVRDSPAVISAGTHAPSPGRARGHRPNAIYRGGRDDGFTKSRGRGYTSGFFPVTRGQTLGRGRGLVPAVGIHGGWPSARGRANPQGNVQAAFFNWHSRGGNPPNQPVKTSLINVLPDDHTPSQGDSRETHEQDP